VEAVPLAVLAAVVSCAATPLVRRLALRVGAVDQPGDWHVHVVPMPRLGGLAVALGIAGAAVVGYAVRAPLTTQALADGARMWGLGAGALVVLVIGALDDGGTVPRLREAGPRHRGAARADTAPVAQRGC
jgi:UDP-GlcNAc:undecaprenyl-phosphate GlcNAc-1-phosphate transferase